MSLISWGVIVHLIILRGMIDMYYDLPLADVRELRSMPSSSPSKRVILMVYENNPHCKSFRTNYSSIFEDEFLRTILASNGTIGLAKAASWKSDQTSYAALLAGIEQNSKTLFFFWKMFDHAFDSIVVHVKNAWIWISHFGADYIIETKYSPNHLFVKVKNYTIPLVISRDILCMFNPYLVSPKNPLYEDGNLFFITLTDQDLIMQTDKNIQPMLHLLHLAQSLDKTFEDYYENDARTTFILTQQFGTSEDSNVMYIAWGAGISPSSNWSVPIKHTDIPVLIATLLGIEIPKNSKGIVPIDILKISNLDKAQALLENVKQLYTLYTTADRERRKDQLFEPFKLLTDNNTDRMIEDIETKLREKDINASINMTQTFIKRLFLGFDYMKMHDCFSLASFLGMGLIFWAIVLVERIMPVPATNIVQNETIHCIFGNNYKIVAIRIASLTIWFFILNTVLNCVDRGINAMQMFYRLLPLINLYLIFINFQRPYNWFYDVWVRSKFFGFIKAMASAWFYFFMTEIMVLGFLIFPKFSFVPVAIFSLWQLVIVRRIAACPIMILRCTLLSVALILLMYLQTIKNQVHMRLYLTYGVFFWYSYAIIANIQYCTLPMLMRKEIKHLFIKWQTLLVFLTGFIVVLVAKTQISYNLEEWLQCFTSVLIVWSFVSPAYGELNLEDRTVNITISLAIPILLVCSSFEALAILVVVMNVRFWLDLELEMNSRKIASDTPRVCCSWGSYTKCFCGTQSPNLNIRSIEFKFSRTQPSDVNKNCTSDDFRRVLFWIYFVMISILSHSSFDKLSISPYTTIHRLLFRSNCCIFEVVLLVVKLLCCTLVPSVIFRWYLVITGRSYSDIQKIVYLFSIPFIVHIFGLIYLIPEYEIGLTALIIWSTFPILMSFIYMVAYVMTSLDLRITLSKIKLRNERVNDVDLTQHA